MQRLLITGANGHLGRRLIDTLPPDAPITAVVRREGARAFLAPRLQQRVNAALRLVNPSDAHALAEAATGCELAVHLIGTIKETRDNRYVDTHERPARALHTIAARAGIKHIVYVSILGAEQTSHSAVLRARAAVEHLLRRGEVPTTIIRVPMVLGEGDRASRALARRARAAHTWSFRAQSLEQPIYAGDVIAAIVKRLAQPASEHVTFDLAGPESLPRAALIRRAGACLNNRPRVHSLPLACGWLLAAVAEVLNRRPPLTREMLRLLDHDDAIDPAPAARALGISLTPLDVMLARCLA